MNIRRVFISSVFLCLIATYATASVIPISLNYFYSDPTVSVSAVSDGTATMREDQGLSSVFLSNDPGLRDSGLIIPENVLSLEFNLSFSEPSGNDDSFFAFLFDDYSNPIDEIYLDADFNGSVSWDMTGLDPSLDLLGLEFQLNAGAQDALYSSVAIISNLRWVTGEPSPVPEPGTLALLGAGLAGLAIYRKKNRK